MKLDFSFFRFLNRAESKTAANCRHCLAVPITSNLLSVAAIAQAFFHCIMSVCIHLSSHYARYNL